MQLNGYQIYVKDADMHQISATISEYVKAFGCKAYVDIDSDKSNPILSRRNQRTFTISIPKHGFISIWEDGGWADKKLARYLSKKLEAQVIWLMLSNVTNAWGYIEYSRGKQIDRHTDTSDQFLDLAEKFAAQHHLPHAFLYFPDPNLSSELEKFDAYLRNHGIEDESDPGHLEVALTEDATRQENKKEIAKDKQNEQLEGDLKKEIAQFVNITLPCKDSAT